MVPAHERALYWIRKRSSRNFIGDTVARKISSICIPLTYCLMWTGWCLTTSYGCGMGTLTSYGTYSGRNELVWCWFVWNRRGVAILTFFSTVYGTCLCTVYGTGIFFSMVMVLMCSWCSWCSLPPKWWSWWWDGCHPQSPIECRPRFVFTVSSVAWSSTFFSAFVASPAASATSTAKQQGIIIWFMTKIQKKRKCSR